MKRIKHVLIVAVALILTCAISVAATYAYLYDESDTARNVITVGKVKVSLSEAKVNEDGEPVDENGKVVADVKDAARVISNHCELARGGKYNIAPTIYVEEGSEDCILLVLIYMPYALEKVIKYDRESTDPEDFGVQFVANGWYAPGIVENVNDANGNLIGRYKWFAYAENGYPRTVSGGATVPFIKYITIIDDSDADLKSASAADMEITAFAFQSEEWGDDIGRVSHIIDILEKAYDLYGN